MNREDEKFYDSVIDSMLQMLLDAILQIQDWEEIELQQQWFCEYKGMED